MATSNKAEMLAKLPVRPDEDPFVVATGGFYRRWFNLVDDLQPMLDTVAKLKGTEDEDWVPAWSAVAARYETDAEAALKRGDKAAARSAFIQAKTYYSLARFPSPYRGGVSSSSDARRKQSRYLLYDSSLILLIVGGQIDEPPR